MYPPYEAATILVAVLSALDANQLRAPAEVLSVQVTPESYDVNKLPVKTPARILVHVLSDENPCHDRVPDDALSIHVAPESADV